MLETIDGVQRFFASYPMWARALASAGFLVGILTLVLAPRSAPPSAIADQGGSRGQGTDTSSSQGQLYWLTVDGIELFPANPQAEVQVQIDVNGTVFQYPSVGGVEWMNVGPAMSPQRFRLPPIGAGYDVRLEMTVREGSLVTRLASQSVESVSVLPFKSTYQLHQVSGMTRAAGVAATVTYSVAAAR